MNDKTMEFRSIVTFLWHVATRILKGKAKGWKLLVFSVFLLSVGTLLEIIYRLSVGAAVFLVLGINAFAVGIEMYKKEVESSL